MSHTYLISDAAKMVEVESHVLRYWEEELSIPIKRNELGHRYYTDDDINQFKEIRELKRKGLQLKAIRIYLDKGSLEVSQPAITMLRTKNIRNQEITEQNMDKAERLRWLLKQFFKDTLQENNTTLCNEIKESVLKELDYQFRMQDEKVEERTKEQTMREEAHYQKIDELLRKKKGNWIRRGKK